MTKKLAVALETETVSDYWDGERYGEWSTRYSYRGCTATLNGGGRIGWNTDVIDVPDSVEELTPLWVVVVAYSSGNSFGRSCGNTALGAVCYSREDAEAVGDAIRKDAKDNPSSFENIIVGDHEIYPGSWKGYFESLESVHIEKVRVETE